MIKEKKSLKVSRSPSRRKFFKTAAATGVAAVAASSLSAPAVAKERIEASMVATWPRDFPGLGTGAQRLAQRLSDMSDGRIQVIGERYDDNRFLGVSRWLEKESEKFNE